MIENYRGQSADGISLRFLGIWMLGDLTNLIGAFYGGLYVLLGAFSSPFVEFFMGHVVREKNKLLLKTSKSQVLNEQR